MRPGRYFTERYAGAWVVRDRQAPTTYVAHTARSRDAADEIKVALNGAHRRRQKDQGVPDDRTEQ